MAAGEFADWQDSLRPRLAAVTWPKEFDEIVEKLSTGIPLSLQDGVQLFNSKDLNTIGSLPIMLSNLALEITPTST